MLLRPCPWPLPPLPDRGIGLAAATTTTESNFWFRYYWSPELAGAPDEVAAVPRLMAELGVTGVLFTADALHCQKDGFAQAAATGNALLVRVKDNQPTLHATLAGLYAAGCPFDSHETVDPAANPLGFGEAARSTAASRCSTPRANWTRPGRRWSAASPECRA